MSTPHDPWSAGPSHSPEPQPPDPRESHNPSYHSPYQPPPYQPADQSQSYPPQSYPPPVSQSPGYQPSGDQPSGYQASGYRPPAYPGTDYPAPFAAYSNSPATPPSRRRRPLLIAAGAVLLLVLATAGFLLLRPSSAPAFTFAGKKIANADDVLGAAQSSTAKLVSSRHGASNSGTRCYFARPTAPAAGTKKSDVDDHVYCGPVLFVDGDTSKTYLSYPMTRSSISNNGAVLTADTTPVSQDPQSTPAGTTLARPDKLAPDTASALAVPDPPPAAAGVFTTTADLAGQSLASAPSDSVIGSRNGGVKITNLATITRYGRGDDARSAPTGQKLIAFRTAAGPDEDGSAQFPYGAVTVVAAGQTHSVPKNATIVVIAVPTAASSADLVVDDAGVTQKISLLTGKPAPGNLAVERRRYHSGTTSGTKSLNFTLAAGGDKASRGARATLNASDLRYWARAADERHAASPSSALLWVDVTYTYTSGVPKPFTGPADRGPFGFAPQLLTLRLPGGAVVHARNYANTKDGIYILFPVSASFTTGTLTISGSEPVNQHGVVRAVTGSTTFPLRIPPG